MFFFVLFVLLFQIVHWCIDIEDRSLSGLYFNKIILPYLILSYKKKNSDAPSPCDLNRMNPMQYFLILLYKSQLNKFELRRFVRVS